MNLPVGVCYVGQCVVQDRCRWINWFIDERGSAGIASPHRSSLFPVSRRGNTSDNANSVCQQHYCMWSIDTITCHRSSIICHEWIILVERNRLGSCEDLLYAICPSVSKDVKRPYNRLHVDSTVYSSYPMGKEFCYNKQDTQSIHLFLDALIHVQALYAIATI